MKSNKEVLSSITKTTQMGQLGIRCVLERAENSKLREALRSQLKEYDMIEEEALNIAEQKNGQIQQLDPTVKLMASACTKATLMMGNVDSRIAAMMINGNTRGLIKSIKNQHHAQQEDPKINKLAEKLIAHESDNIRQMQEFL